MSETRATIDLTFNFPVKVSLEFLLKNSPNPEKVIKKYLQGKDVEGEAELESVTLKNFGYYLLDEEVKSLTLFELETALMDHLETSTIDGKNPVLENLNVV